MFADVSWPNRTEMVQLEAGAGPGQAGCACWLLFADLLGVHGPGRPGWGTPPHQTLSVPTRFPSPTEGGVEGSPIAQESTCSPLYFWENLGPWS